MSESVETGTIKTKIPARLDRKAERESLESIAKPLTVEDSPRASTVPATAG
jgi:hypothetical protein